MTHNELVEDIKKQPQYLSVEILPTPEYLTLQLEVDMDGNKVIDRDTILIDAVFEIGGNIPRPIRLVMNNELLSNMPTDCEFGKHFVKELVCCDVDCDVCSDSGSWSYSNKCENMGDPPTYYLNPLTLKGQRLYAYPTEPIPMTPEIESLMEQLNQFPGVDRVLIEYSRNEEIDKKFEGNPAIVISIYRDQWPIPVNAFYSLSALSNMETISSIVDNMSSNLIKFKLSN
jgi:hypothetical protein